MPTPTTKPTCVVSIGYTTLLLTADMGAKLMTMLASAIPVSHDPESAYRGWVADREPLRLEMQMVAPRELRLVTPATPSKPTRRAAPLQLTQRAEGDLL